MARSLLARLASAARRLLRGPTTPAAATRSRTSEGAGWAGKAPTLAAVVTLGIALKDRSEELKVHKLHNVILENENEALREKIASAELKRPKKTTRWWSHVFNMWR